jgi:quinoprotein glucose dehydrogenase
MMNKMKSSVLLLTPLALVLLSLSPASAQSLPDGEGKDVYETVCGACHGADIVIGSQGTKSRWEETVDAMKNRGASGSDADFTTVVNYLARYFGMSLNMNTATADEMEKELGLSKAESGAIVTKRTAAKIKDYNDLTATPGVDKKKLDLVKSRLKF